MMEKVSIIGSGNIAHWMAYAITCQGMKLQQVYKAQDFTTAEYFLFLAMKSLQLNPEVSTVYWRMPVGPEEELSLYRYFKAVDRV